MKTVFRSLIYRSTRALAACDLAVGLVSASSAQKGAAQTWEQVHDLFLRANPALRAQEQENQVVQNAETACAELVSTRDRFKPYEGTYLDEAKDPLEIEEFSFHKGGASILDYLGAQRTHRATQPACRQQLAAYYDALGQLQTADGMDVTR